MDDDTDMTAEDFWADVDEGIPVQVVLTRREYEAALGRGTKAAAQRTVCFSRVTGLGDDAAWLLTGCFSTSGGSPTTGPVHPPRVAVGAD